MGEVGGRDRGGAEPGGRAGDVRLAAYSGIRTARVWVLAFVSVGRKNPYAGSRRVPWAAARMRKI